MSRYISLFYVCRSKAPHSEVIHSEMIHSEVIHSEVIHSEVILRMGWHLHLNSDRLVQCQPAHALA